MFPGRKRNSYIPDLDERTTHFEQRQVLSHGHIATGNGRDNQVQRAGILPMSIIGRGRRDVLVGAKRENILALGFPSRNSDNPIGVHSLGK